MKIRDREDLKRLFNLADKNRRDQKGKPRFTREFLDRVTQTTLADQYVGDVVGSERAKPLVFKNTPIVTENAKRLAKEYRDKGKDVYRYQNGYAVKLTRKTTRTGNVSITFVDVESRKKIDPKTIIEE